MYARNEAGRKNVISTWPKRIGADKRKNEPFMRRASGPRKKRAERRKRKRRVAEPKSDDQANTPLELGINADERDSPDGFAHLAPAGLV